MTGRGAKLTRALIAAFMAVNAGAVSAQQADPYAERQRLDGLKSIDWSAAAAARYPVKLPPVITEHVWTHPGSVSSVNFSPDTRLVVTGAWKEGRLYETASGKLLHTLKPKRPSYVIVAAVAPDGKTVYTGAGDGTTRQWDVTSGKMLREWGHWKDVEDLDFSPHGGRYVATSAADRTAKIWDTVSGKKIVELPHKGTVLPLDFTPDGVRLLTGAMDNFARLWDLRTGKPIHEWEHGGQVGAAEVSPNGKFALTGSNDGTARLFDLETGAEVHRWTHDGTVFDVNFSPDGKLVVTAGGDSVAKVWNVETKALVQTLAHKAIVSYARFTPDGRFVMTGSRDKTAVLWVAETGQKRAILQHDDGIRSLAFSADGRLALTGSFDKKARLFDLGKHFDLERTAAYLRARFGQILDYNMVQYIGPPPIRPKVDPRGPEERESAYLRRATAAKGLWVTRQCDYRKKRKTFPLWRRNQILEYAFYSVFGHPVIKDVRHDATDSRVVVVIGSNSPVAGGFERHFLLKVNVPQANAAAMTAVLRAGTPMMTLAFDKGTLRFADAFIEAGGRIYTGEFVDDGPASFVLLREESEDEAEKPKKSQ